MMRIFSSYETSWERSMSKNKWVEYQLSIFNRQYLLGILLKLYLDQWVPRKEILSHVANYM